MPEHRVLAAVVEVQVGVDHQRDVGGGHVQLGQRAGRRDVDHAPVAEQVLRTSDAGVDQDSTVRMGDHEAVNRPLPPLTARRSQLGQVQSLDLQRHGSIVPSRTAIATWPRAAPPEAPGARPGAHRATGAGFVVSRLCR